MENMTLVDMLDEMGYETTAPMRKWCIELLQNKEDFNNVLATKRKGDGYRQDKILLKPEAKLLVENLVTLYPFKGLFPRAKKKTGANDLDTSTHFMPYRDLKSGKTRKYIEKKSQRLSEQMQFAIAQSENTLKYIDSFYETVMNSESIDITKVSLKGELAKRCSKSQLYGIKFKPEELSLWMEISELKNELEKEPDNHFLYFKISKKMFEIGDYNSALEMIEEAVEFDAEKLIYLKFKAKILLRILQRKVSQKSEKTEIVEDLVALFLPETIEERFLDLNEMEFHNWEMNVPTSDDEYCDFIASCKELFFKEKELLEMIAQEHHVKYKKEKRAKSIIPAISKQLKLSPLLYLYFILCFNIESEKENCNSDVISIIEFFDPLLDTRLLNKCSLQKLGLVSYVKVKALQICTEFSTESIDVLDPIENHFTKMNRVRAIQELSSNSISKMVIEMVGIADYQKLVNNVIQEIHFDINSLQYKAAIDSYFELFWEQATFSMMSQFNNYKQGNHLIEHDRDDDWISEEDVAEYNCAMEKVYGTTDFERASQMPKKDLLEKELNDISEIFSEADVILPAVPDVTKVQDDHLLGLLFWKGLVEYLLSTASFEESSIKIFFQSSELLRKALFAQGKFMGKPMFLDTLNLWISILPERFSGITADDIRALLSEQKNENVLDGLIPIFQISALKKVTEYDDII